MLTNAPRRVCAVEGCGNTHLEGRGYCLRHYASWRKHGDATHSDRRRQRAAEKGARTARRQKRTEPPRIYTTLPGYELHDAYRSKLLWLCVLLQAVSDAVSPPRAFAYHPSASTTSPQQREQARAWLLTFNPDFALVCDLAGLHPSYVSTRARALIEQRDRLHRMAAAFAKAGGYAETSERSPGTGGGRHVHDLPGSNCCNQLHGGRR